MTITLSRFNVKVDEKYENNVYTVLKSVFLDTRTPFSAWLVTQVLKQAVGEGINIEHDVVKRIVHKFMAGETNWVATHNGQHITYSPMTSNPSAAKFSFIDSGDTVAPGTQKKFARAWVEKSPYQTIFGGSVVSSWISKVEWFFDPDTNPVLEITMKNGEAYQYFGVDRALFSRVYSGDYNKRGIFGEFSVGKAYSELVKGKFESVKKQ